MQSSRHDTLFVTPCAHLGPLSSDAEFAPKGGPCGRPPEHIRHLWTPSQHRHRAAPCTHRPPRSHAGAVRACAVGLPRWPSVCTRLRGLDGTVGPEGNGPVSTPHREGATAPCTLKTLTSLFQPQKTGGGETPRTREKGIETAREGGGRPRALSVWEAGCERSLPPPRERRSPSVTSPARRTFRSCWCLRQGQREVSSTPADLVPTQLQLQPQRGFPGSTRGGGEGG